MSTEVVKISEKTVMPFVQPKMKELIELIGNDNLIREMSFAIQAANGNSYLSTATPASVGRCVFNVAITGLSLNPVSKLAYLTPRKVGQNVEAILMPSYQGICKLLTDTGSVVNVYAHVVYAGDTFEPSLGLEVSLKHIPKYTSKEMTHVYAVGVLHDGSKMFEVMSKQDVDKIRDLSDGWKAYKAGKTNTAIWNDHYDEMARKTVIKRLAKYLPKTNNWEKVNQAIEIDNSEYDAPEWMYGKIETLLLTCAYDDDYKESIRKQISSTVSKQEADRIVWDLECNQLNKIESGLPYNASDISKQIETKE